VIGSTRQIVVYAYRESVDMRKAFDALTALVVPRLRHDVMSGEMYLFVSRTRKRAKVLYWDGTGLCLRYALAIHLTRCNARCGMRSL